MEGEERREKILQTIMQSEMPVSGSKLADRFSVSRQVIVQDIALLKAAGKDIISTVRGYQIPLEKKCRRYIHVDHGRESIEEELTAIVDNGGCIITTGIDHPTYGRITVEMDTASRKDVKAFVEKSQRNDFFPLSTLTSGKHFHLIEAQTPDDMDAIEKALDELGILTTP